MATRYWVGGTGNWDGSTTTNWSASSGGAGGASVPTSSDDVIFDANSGTGTATIWSVNAFCRSLDMTNYSGTFSGLNSLVIGGGSTASYLKLGSAMTNNFTGDLYFVGNQTGNTITPNGKVIASLEVHVGEDNSHSIFYSGDWTLQGDFTIGSTTGAFYIHSGTFISNGKNISVQTFNASNANTRTINLSGSTVTFTGNSPGWDFTTTTGLTFTPPALLLLPDGMTFRGGGLTYNALEVQGKSFSENGVLITGANTLSTLTLDKDSSTALPASTTTTISQLISNGISGHLATLKSSTSGTAAILSCAALVAVNYMSIQDSTASGHTPFYAGNNSTNVSGNTNWNFTNPPVTATFDAFQLAGD